MANTVDGSSARASAERAVVEHGLHLAEQVAGVHQRHHGRGGRSDWRWRWPAAADHEVQRVGKIAFAEQDIAADEMQFAPAAAMSRTIAGGASAKKSVRAGAVLREPWSVERYYPRRGVVAATGDPVLRSAGNGVADNRGDAQAKKPASVSAGRSSTSDSGIDGCSTGRWQLPEQPATAWSWWCRPPTPTTKAAWQAVPRVVTRFAPGWPRCPPRPRSTVHDGVRPFADMHVFQLVGTVAGGADRGDTRHRAHRHDQAGGRRWRSGAHTGAACRDDGRADAAGVQGGRAARCSPGRQHRHRRRRAGRATGGRIGGRRRRPGKPQDHRHRRPHLGQAASAGRCRHAGTTRRARTTRRAAASHPSGPGLRHPSLQRRPGTPLVLGGVVFEGSRLVARPQRRRRRGRGHPTHCSAPPDWATSASTSPTPTRSGKGPIRCNCYVMRWPSSRSGVPGG